MKGILLVSHGKMAEGMIDSLQMFFGENIPQLDFLSVKMDTGVEEFRNSVIQKINELDTGDGVVIFADVLGGTPFNQSATLVSDKVDLIVGMNLGMLMDFLGSREYEEFDADALVEKGKNAVINAKALLYAEEDDLSDLDSLE